MFRERWEPLFYKLELLGNFGWMHGLLSCEACFFVYCVLKQIVDHSPRRYLYARTRLRLWLPRARYAKVRFNSFLQVSCSSNESVVQQERSNCIVSSIRLSVPFDWRNFALALAAPLQSFLCNFRLACEW